MFVYYSRTCSSVILKKVKLYDNLVKNDLNSYIETCIIILIQYMYIIYIVIDNIL